MFTHLFFIFVGLFRRPRSRSVSRNVVKEEVREAVAPAADEPIQEPSPLAITPSKSFSHFYIGKRRDNRLQ